MDTRHVILRGEHLHNLHDYLADATYRLKWDERQGYSAAFAREHDEILKGIVENPECVVTVVTGTDDICNRTSCPRKRPYCQSEDLMQKDRTIAQKYGVVIGQQYKSRDLIALLAKKERA